ncbi:heavy metal-binding domain-containing protein [Viridibacillus sp. FSL R5-0477]|uniref:Uncharacterized protein n=1 Tax=Viridibacillus arenosi FSL R5-213 TaxID=1227360 RepID=W4F4A5_9BACL|nr:MULTISPECIES: heavy metal-binding domain-containing protein [Viridibacillus]ETT87304.1 hypothetical protein C176_04108 [Viridibacillus arenosi FSL R5-213]OMC80101.1 hypothetical protein BK130_17205 [Viridibacillus sp. FSL H8-0123]OMC87872.1 hypothetical protein BK128_06005 [Viridibacillus sp. FSL H7-0596]OMC91422.1 hypothetical protein BK137_10130 [Viridibacillus arenosi]
MQENLKILITTIEEVITVVEGVIVTSKNIGRDILGSLRGTMSGENKSYTEMTKQHLKIQRIE